MIIDTQRVNLEEKNNSIISGLKHASHLQEALFPKFDNINDIFSEIFVINIPKDIVSGDFFWMKKIKNENFDITLFAAADCTGHGVSGAMMSMLAIALLNEIIYRKSIKTSNQVLDELRFQIKKSLMQTGQRFERQDGLDIAFCIIDNKTKEMSFSGAYNPVWIYRKNIVTENDKDNTYDYIELKADKQPIGIYPKEIPFTENKIQLEKNDIIYIFSDGFHSQIDKSGKKLKKKDMRKMFDSVINLPLEEQKYCLETQFNNWKGNSEQIDDVLVFGAKLQ